MAFPMLSPGANPGGAPSGGGFSSVTSPFGMPSPSGVGHNSIGGVVGGSGATKGPLGGKNSHQQDLVSPHAGNRSTLASGAPSSRAVGQYGKGHDALSGLTGGASLPKSATNAAGHAGLGQIRGGTGQMRRIRGGLGPGKTGQAGPTPKGGGYAMNNFDTE